MGEASLRCQIGETYIAIEGSIALSSGCPRLARNNCFLPSDNLEYTMGFYGQRHFKGKGYDYGCCPGHDRVYVSAWNTRTCETTRRLKRYPKKVARQRAKADLRKYY